MKPVSEIELKKINDVFRFMKEDGCTDLKAAYLATSGAGFNEIVMSKNKTALFHRQSDDTFIVLFTEKKTVMVPKEIETINFTVDTKAFMEEK
jgi:hypothetical protein